MIKIKFLKALDLLEIYLILQLLILIFVGIATNIMIIPFAILLIPSIRFTFCIIVLWLCQYLIHDQYKTNITLGVFKSINMFPIHFEFLNCDPKSLTNKCIISNYPANFFEYLLLPCILSEWNIPFKIVVGIGAHKWAKHFLKEDNLILLRGEKNFDFLQKLKRQNNCTLIVYPERNILSRTNIHEILPFRSGLINIAGADLVICKLKHIEHSAGVIKTSNWHLKLFSSNRECSAEEAWNIMNEM